ncbi:MAG: hypothetical protein N3A58_08395, partial [Spirochaetes bacterium]|nr:hypothetical protein [Spirochaetota bacterium]
MNKKNRFLEFIEYILVKLIFGIFHLFPYEKGIRFGSKLFKILYIIPILRKIAYKNIEFIFHDYENFSKLYNINIPFKKFKKIIFLKNLENLGKIFFTLIYSPKINQKNISSLIKNNVDMALFNKLFEERKGLICLSFHFGNWELNGIFFSMMGYPINVIFRPLDNKLLDRYLQKYRSDK